MVKRAMQTYTGEYKAYLTSEQIKHCINISTSYAGLIDRLMLELDKNQNGKI